MSFPRTPLTQELLDDDVLGRLPAVPQKREARHRILRVPVDIAFQSLLCIFRRGEGFIEIPHCEGLPPDCEVVAACHDFERNEFRFRLYHPSFSVVQENSSVPAINPMYSLDRLKIVTGSVRETFAS